VFLYLLQLKQQTNSDFKSNRLEFLFKELENYAEYSENIVEFLFLLKERTHKCLMKDVKHSNGKNCDKSFFYLEVGFLFYFN
jgi:hypothetical protein